MLKRGIKTLSQKQRLANACALYRDPQVLIFDEATSSLDSISEEQVQQTIQKLKKQGKTIILIAHRLGTVLQADKIDGRGATQQSLCSKRKVLSDVAKTVT